jgi:hypothetical protein
MSELQSHEFISRRTLYLEEKEEDLAKSKEIEEKKKKTKERDEKRKNRQKPRIGAPPPATS